MSNQKRIGFTHESARNESVDWYTPPELFDALGRHPSVLSVRAQGSIRQEIREEEGQVERFTLVVRLARGDLAAGGAP